MKEFGRVISLRGEGIEISVAPDMGFSLVSFIRNGVQLLDLDLADQFFRCRKGLGPLIVPHFNQEAGIPQFDRDAFPHIQELEKLGIKHPFQHGLGRYVPWKFSVGKHAIVGRIEGDMKCNGYKMSSLAGFDFSARVGYELIPGGLEISFMLEGENPVAAGIHFYYNLFSKNTATVLIPEDMMGGQVRMDFGHSINQVFAFKKAPREAQMVCTLSTDAYSLNTSFQYGGAQEDSFDSLVVFAPAGSNFACIEPISYIVGERNAKRRFHGKIQLLAMNKE
jgi:hypothetical protein